MELRSDAIHEDKYPVYMVNFNDDSKHSYYLISDTLFNELKEYLESDV